jgi:hypothetical protein
MIFMAKMFDIDYGLGILHVQRFQVLYNDPDHSEVAEPFVIGWDDKPGCMFGAAPGQGVLIG